MSDCSVVELFCGVGGLAHGFKKEGFDIAAGYDADESCRYAFEMNNDSTFYHKKVEDLEAKHVHNQYRDSEGDIKILVGCAPCQPYSSYTDEDKRRKGQKWKLLEDFSRLIGEVEPDVVAMENVPELRTFGDVFEQFVFSLRELGYTDQNGSILYDNVYCPDYGVPQTRNRLVLLASKLGKICMIDPTHDPNKQTVRRTIKGELPEIQNGETCPKDPIHKASSLSDLNLRRIKSSKPGGTWEDWDEELLAECHKKESGNTYKSVYGRMEWDRPAPTITTQFYGFGNGRFGHPKQDRAISLREGALLQTFPKNYVFVSPDAPVYFNRLGRHIGNAVPVNLGRAIAKSIRKHVIFHQSK